MKKRYLRLKLRLLLIMVGRAVGIAAVCLMVGRLLQTTVLGDLVWAGLACPTPIYEPPFACVQ